MLPTEDAIGAAEELARRFGLPPGSSRSRATDANRFAIRLAREITRRPKILVFDYCYHGTVDETFATLRRRPASSARPGNVGPPVDPALTTKVVAVERRRRTRAALAPGDVACVLAEPALTNIGIVLPERRFPRRPARADAPDRHAPRHRRDAHVQRRAGRLHRGAGGSSRTAHDREGDRRRRPRRARTASPRSSRARIEAREDADYEDVGGIGGTLAGNALSLAAVRATLGEVLTDEAFARMIPLGGPVGRGTWQT